MATQWLGRCYECVQEQDIPVPAGGTCPVDAQWPAMGIPPHLFIQPEYEAKDEAACILLVHSGHAPARQSVPFGGKPERWDSGRAPSESKDRPGAGLKGWSTLQPGCCAGESFGQRLVVVWLQVWGTDAYQGSSGSRAERWDGKQHTMGHKDAPDTVRLMRGR